MIKNTLITLSALTSLSAMAGQRIHVDLDGFFPSVTMTMLIQSLETEIVQEATRICGSVDAIERLSGLSVGPVQDSIRNTDAVPAEIRIRENGKVQIAYMSYTKIEATADVVCKP